MKKINTLILLALISTMALFLTACSDETDKSTSKKENTGDHVWKTQTDALQSAKDMSKKMQEDLKLQEEKMNNID